MACSLSVEELAIIYTHARSEKSGTYYIISEYSDSCSAATNFTKTQEISV